MICRKFRTVCIHGWMVLSVAVCLVSCSVHSPSSHAVPRREASPSAGEVSPVPQAEASMDAFFDLEEKEAVLMQHGKRLYENGVEEKRYRDLSRSLAVFAFLKEQYQNPEAAAYLDKAAAERRTALESLAGQAETARAGGDVYTAALHYRGILALDPADSRAGRFLADNRQEIERLWGATMAKGDAHLAEEEFAAAEESYRRALALKPDSQRAQQKIRLVAAQKEQSAGFFFGKGVYAFEREDYQTAKKAFQTALEKDHRPEEAARYLKQIELVERYNRMEAAYKKGDLLAARKAAQAILAGYGDYQSTRKYLHLIEQKLAQQLQEWYAEAVSLYNGKEYARAKSLFDQIRRIDADYENVAEYSIRCQAVMETLGEN